MKTIVMDSANQYLVVALYEDGKCLDSIQELGNRKQSEYAIVELQKLLEKHHLNVLDFDEMVITIGPGSYTGERVALTIAKTIAATSPIQIKVVSSLKAIAGMKKVISILDARSQKAYLGIYNQGKTIVQDCLVEQSSLQDYINQYPDYEVLGDLSLIQQESKDIDYASNIYELSLLEDYVKDIDTLVPEYIKDVEAKKICQ